MHNLVIPAPPPNLDSFAPEFCHCGKRTVESHEFWYCSTNCAREDSLQSLGNNRCHYRENVRKAHALAGVQGSHPRRIMFIDHLRHAASERRGLFNAPPRVPSPKNLPQRKPTLTCRDARDRNMAGLPTLTQVTGRILVHKANAGEALIATRQDRHKWEGHPIAPSCTRPVETCQEHTFAEISLDALPLPEPGPPHSPRRLPQMNDGPKGSIRKSVTALLTGKSRKGRNGENRIFGHPVNTFVPPVRKESLPSHYQKSPPSANPVPSSRTLRRSASFAGWDTPVHGGPSNQDPLMHIIEELRAEVSENFDPKSLFELNEAY